MEDIYGCLYFHISDQLKALSKRIKSLSITFHLAQLPVQQLVEDLQQGKLSKNGLSPTIKFDRIDVSNILDDNYVGIEPLLTKWKPFLADTKHAAIVGYFMNWSHPKFMPPGDSSTWLPTKAETTQAVAACIAYADQVRSVFLYRVVLLTNCSLKRRSRQDPVPRFRRTTQVTLLRPNLSDAD